MGEALLSIAVVVLIAAGFALLVLPDGPRSVGSMLVRAGSTPEKPDAWTGAQRVASASARLLRWLLALVAILLGVLALTGSRLPGTDYELGQCSTVTKTTQTPGSTETKTSTPGLSTTRTSGNSQTSATATVATKTCAPRSITDPVVLAGALFVAVLLLPAFSELSIGSLFSVKLRQDVAAAAQAAGDAKDTAKVTERKVEDFIVSMSSAVAHANARADASINQFFGARPKNEATNGEPAAENAKFGAANSALVGINLALRLTIGDDPVVTVFRWSRMHRVLVPVRINETPSDKPNLVDTPDPPDTRLWLDEGSEFAEPTWRYGLFQTASLEAVAQLDIGLQALLRGAAAYPFVYLTPIWKDRVTGEKHGLLAVSSAKEIKDAAGILDATASQITVVVERLISWDST